MKILTVLSIIGIATGAAFYSSNANSHEINIPHSHLDIVVQESSDDMSLSAPGTVQYKCTVAGKCDPSCIKEMVEVFGLTKMGRVVTAEGVKQVRKTCGCGD